MISANLFPRIASEISLLYSQNVESISHSYRLDKVGCNFKKLTVVTDNSGIDLTDEGADSCAVDAEPFSVEDVVASVEDDAFADLGRGLT